MSFKKKKEMKSMGTLQVRIIRCFNIKSISITGNVDPYVIITTGHEYSWNKHNSKTRIVYKNKNPVWDQAFAFKVKRYQTGCGANDTVGS